MSDQVDLPAGMYDQYSYMMFMLPHLTRAKVVVETGLGATADSTRIWLSALDKMPDPESRVLYTFEQNETIANSHRSLQADYKARWIVILVDDRAPEAAQRLPPGTKIDVLYLDAGHDRYEVDAELRNFAPMLADTGVLLTHDSYARVPPHVDEGRYPDGYTGPTPTYEALKAWADARGWRTLLLTHPLGMTLCYKV
jgi:predicted O-methyltransferase YrrM